jgi:hypothetical protein
LTLRTAARPNPGRYKANLLVTGEDGTSATRPFVLTVPKPPTSTPPAGTAEPARLLPRTVEDFSDDGINFVPSLISPPHAFELGLGVVLVFLALPALLMLARNRFLPDALVGWSMVVLLSGIALGGLGIVEVTDDAFFTGATVSAVKVRAIPVDPGASPGPVGTLVAKDGTPVMAVVDHAAGALSVGDVPRSGAYSGGIDLLAGQDGGEATMTLNVRDYWPYAFIVIALGVLLGARLSQYFTRDRPFSIVKRKLNEINDELGRAEDELRTRDPSIAKLYSVKEVVDARLQAIERDARTREPDALIKANKDIDSLTAFVATARRLWPKLERVEALRAQVAAAIESSKVGIRTAEVPALAKADALLRPPGLQPVDTDPEAFTSLQQDATSATALLDAVANDLPDIQRMLAVARQIPGDLFPTQQGEELRKMLKDLTAAAKEAIRQGTPEEVRTKFHAFADKWRDLDDWLKKQTLSDGTRSPGMAPPAAEAVQRPQAVPRVRRNIGLRQSISRLRRRQRFPLIDRGMTLATGLLAVFSGLLALYSASPTWGTPADYLKAFLWGSVVSEGVKAVTALVGKTGAPGG